MKDKRVVYCWNCREGGDGIYMQVTDVRDGYPTEVTWCLECYAYAMRDELEKILETRLGK